MTRVILIRSRATHPNTIKISKILLKHGYNVTLLLWNRQGGYFENNTDLEIITFNLKAPQDKSIVFLFIPLWWIFIFKFLLTTKYDVIHAADLDTLIPAILIKVIKQVKVNYSIYDFYADCAFGRAPKILRYLISNIEKYGIGFTDILFLVTESQYLEVKGAKITKLVILYNSPIEPIQIIKNVSHKHQGKFKIFYAGVLHRERGLIFIIEAIKKMDEIELTVAGVGPEKNLFHNLSITDQEKIKYLGWIPHEEVISNEIESDVLFSFNNPEFPNNKYAIPNKVLEAMMCGKPIIVNNHTYAAEIVMNENCGLIIPYGDVNAIIDALEKLRDNPDLRQQLGQNGRKAYDNKYSAHLMEKKLVESYKELLI